LNVIVTLIENTLPSPPVTRSLLELLSVNNVTQDNTLGRFVEEPRPFTSENIAPYMDKFTIRRTILEFLGK
jgi:hypothetical protein